MIEMMAARAKSTAIPFPNAGPGSQSIIKGNATLGYMGSVPASGMGGVDVGLTAMMFAAPNGGNFYTSQYVTWYKFVRNNKVFYFPSGICGNCRYGDLEKLGATFGVKDPAVSLPTTLPVSKVAMYKENYIIVARNATFRVRLPRASNTTATLPSTATYLSYDTAEAAQTVLGLSDMTTMPSIGGMAKVNLNKPSISVANERWMVAESVSASITKTMTLSSESSTYVSNATSLVAKWSPILEVIETAELATMVMPTTNITYVS